MIVKTSAVVLREIKYRDQSKICLLLTREFGKVTVIPKAVRNPKNRMNAVFCTGNVIEAVIYRKNTRDIQLVSDGNILISPMTPSPDLERFAVLYRMLDLVRHSTGHEEKNIPLYSLLVRTIGELCSAGCGFRAVLARFLLQLASVLGFEPSIDRCVYSRGELLPAIRDHNLQELHFVHDPGGFALPGAHAATETQSQSVPVSTYLFLLSLAGKRAETAAQEPSPDEVSRLCFLLQDYCNRHLDSMPHRKHLDIVTQLFSA